MVKRIIDGKTYNTETATRIATVSYPLQGQIAFDELYQSRHGAYFQYYGDRYLSDHHGPMEEIVPLTPEEAQEWMEKHAWAGHVRRYFSEQSEAGEAESRVTVRLPDGLKNRIATMAAENNQSLNAWIMRCVEDCVTRQLVTSLMPTVRRGHKFTGHNADRNSYIYGLFRLGHRLDLLASACGLTLPEAMEIIAEGNGGTMPPDYRDGSGGLVRLPASES